MIIIERTLKMAPDTTSSDMFYFFSLSFLECSDNRDIDRIFRRLMFIMKISGFINSVF